MASTRNSPPAENADRYAGADRVETPAACEPLVANVVSSPAVGQAVSAGDRTPEALSDVEAAVGAGLAEFVAPGSSLAVALSGGLDSMVLLDALAAFAAVHPLTLRAIHVNHGLSPHAERWAAFCAEQCATRGVPLEVHRVALDRRPAWASLEARARAARYQRLCSSAADVIALAHHADDQAETVLLQLLRGAGPRGLAAMPRFRPGKPALLRPLLGLTREALSGYAVRQAVDWVDDESNAQRRHRRNFLRHDIVPFLAAHFPGYPATLVRAAEHQAEAGQLLDELAALDAAGACDAGGLERARLAALAPARARNLLRWFLGRKGLRPPSQARLAEMLRQLRDPAPDALTRIAHDGAEIGCRYGRIIVHPVAVQSFSRVWHGESRVPLPGGTLLFQSGLGNGISASKLANGHVTLRSRAGGERLQTAANRPRRALKRLLQEARMPPWERQSLPLVWCGDELAAVPGIGVAVAFQAAPGEVGWSLEWRPLRAGSGAQAD